MQLFALLLEMCLFSTNGQASFRSPARRVCAYDCRRLINDQKY